MKPSTKKFWVSLFRISRSLFCISFIVWIYQLFIHGWKASGGSRGVAFTVMAFNLLVCALLRDFAPGCKRDD